MKLIKNIPNTITSMNLLCGTLGVIVALKGDIDLAFYLMIAGATCDFLDGFAARLLKAYSPMGKELDSLADLITFGFLPSIMLYKCMDIYHPGQWYCYIPLIIVVFSALRLAKFNIDDRQSENFIGLATPACAMICGSFAVIAHYDINNVAGIFTKSTWMIPAASALLSVLLVCELPMFSMKFKKGDTGHLKWIRISFIAVSVINFAVTLILIKPITNAIPHAVMFIFVIYIIMNLAHVILKKLIRTK